MQVHHEVELLTALDELYMRGATSIRLEQLYLWFNATRLHKTAYRQILSRWHELTVDTYGHAEAPELSVLLTGIWVTLTREPFAGTSEEWAKLADRT
jgi:hypothetical protein